MSRTNWGWALAAIGALLAAFSVLADPIGIGEGSGVGWKQVVGTIVGAVVLLAGLALVYAERRAVPPAEAGP
jgi:hypothetical protein